VARLIETDRSVGGGYCNNASGPRMSGPVRTAWRLFNTATFALAGKVAERPDLTEQLHKVIDGVCETVH
jgi:hypothetical protein